MARMMEQQTDAQPERNGAPSRSPHTRTASLASALPNRRISPDLTNPWLSRAEVKSLARTSIKARQIRFLQINHIPHFVDLHGWPVVTRAAVEGHVDTTMPSQPWKSNKAP